MSNKSKRDLLSTIDGQFAGLDLEATEQEPAATATVQHAAVRDALKLNRSTGDLPLDVIDPDPNQVRNVDTTSEDFEGLVSSIRDHGVIQPITVRFLAPKQRFQVVSGERRYQAASRVGLKTIPVVIRDLDDTKKSIHQLVENLQREDLNPVEEARAFHRYLEATGKTQEQLAREIGKSKTYVSRSLSLLEQLTKKEQASLAHVAPAQLPGKSLIFEALRVKDPETRASILSGHLNRQEARAKASSFKKKPLGGRPKHARKQFQVPQVMATVTVTVKKSTATEREIAAALRSALEQCEKNL